mgnify:CR=1 FL=1
MVTFLSNCLYRIIKSVQFVILSAQSFVIAFIPTLRVS